MGLVLFAGEAQVATPPTTDHELVSNAIDEANFFNGFGGTAIGDAIGWFVGARLRRRVTNVNLRRADGFSHVLSASSITAAGSGLFLPLEGNRGETVAADTKSLACAIDPYLGVVAGEPDIVTDASKDTLDDELEHKPGAC